MYHLKVSKFCPRCKRTKLLVHFHENENNGPAKKAGWCRRCMHDDQYRIKYQPIARDLEIIASCYLERNALNDDDRSTTARNVLGELTE